MNSRVCVGVIRTSEPKYCSTGVWNGWRAGEGVSKLLLHHQIQGHSVTYCAKGISTLVLDPSTLFHLHMAHV